jgi:hypothetical protein
MTRKEVEALASAELEKLASYLGAPKGLAFTAGIATAWKLVEIMVSEGWWPRVGAPYGHGKDGHVWTCSYSDDGFGPDDKDDCYVAYGETAPLAITRSFVQFRVNERGGRGDGR